MPQEFKSEVIFGGCGCGAPYATDLLDGTITLSDPKNPWEGWHQTTALGLLELAGKLAQHQDNNTPVVLETPEIPNTGLIRVMRPLSLRLMIEKNRAKIEAIARRG